MAKRKRLSPAQSDYLAAEGPPPETRAMPLGPEVLREAPPDVSRDVPRDVPRDVQRAPIAQVAGAAAAASALEELAGAWTAAREEGRLIQALDAQSIEAGYLVRDRMGVDEEELGTLMESLKARGQQTPIEVVALGEGRYGLISGWRRLTALKRLRDETGEARFGQVMAVLRRPESAAEAYVAMVEENEIRVGLSYYERARVAARAVEQGVFPTEKAALLELYAAASRPKRSKIRSFLRLYHAADEVLRFPAAIGERLGLALAKALETGGAEAALRRRLETAGAETAEAEQAALQAFLKKAPDRAPAADPATNPAANPATPSGDAPPPRARPMPQGGGEIAPGVTAAWSGHRLTLTGPGVSEAFRQALVDWVRSR